MSEMSKDQALAEKIAEMAREDAEFLKKLEEFDGEMRDDEKEFLELQREQVRLQKEVSENLLAIDKLKKTYRKRQLSRLILILIVVITAVGYLTYRLAIKAIN
ncbi:hypothetical protein [Hahella ganghwensis]|uniref:hypothetical protein n=1 Tax=Hahella ganghwensis TaxID=286420 RepID=UPI00035DC52E|nr:hypothetical protein [Hahella ganghwensis]